MLHTILLTIDVEDWFQVENLRPWFSPTQWGNQPSRIERNTHTLLDLLDTISLSQDNSTNPSYPKATFFVLGWIAERFPKLVKEIGKRGHEIASHGYNHMLCNRMDSNSLYQDLEKSKMLLEDISGKKIEGYRAPNFSINDQVLQLIQKCGYTYDSSYNSFDRHRRYGKISTNGFKKKGISIQLSPNLFEIPISNLSLAGQTIPWGGGGYFRFIPPAVFNAGVHRILNTDQAFLFYLHPWEVDPKQPRPKEAKGLSAWRHYLNLDKTYTRLSNIITHFKDCKYKTCSQYLAQTQQP